MRLRTLLLTTQFIAVCAAGFLACSQSSESKLNYKRMVTPSPGVAAKIFGEELLEVDLEKSNIKIFQKRLDVYQAKRREIDERVRKKVFEKLAESKKMTVDEYMAKEMENAKKKTKDEEVARFLKGRVEDPSTAPAHIKDQVKGILHLKKIVASYTAKHPIELHLQRPRAPGIQFNFDGAASWGNKNAPVTLVEYSDFQCPFCQRADDNIVKELKKKFGKSKLRVVFKHFPLSIHKEAKPASMASMCIHEQSQAKFWKYHDIIFQNQRKLGDKDLKSYAKKIGANMKKFEECMSSKKYEQLVQSDFDEGVRIGVNSTPSFFVNSQPILGARPIEEFSELIEEELQRAKKN